MVEKIRKCHGWKVYSVRDALGKKSRTSRNGNSESFVIIEN